MNKSLSAILILFFPFLIFSQKEQSDKTGEDFQHYFTFQSGVGMTGAVLADTWNSPSNSTSSTGPNLFLNYDYIPWGGRVSANICIGMSTGKTKSTDSFQQLTITRGRILTWSTRGLVHFLHKKSIKHDLYTGLGLGIGLISLKGPNDDKFELSSTDVQFNLPFFLGYRYFFMENLGATFELSTFRNNLVSVGLSFRF
ncbi:MAG: hypothetical protein FGM14_09640 [Flavobacteriales bacterium]|nr:hypothetical protein [Flavobacteriales bacterium]